MLAATSSSGTSSDVCAGAGAEVTGTAEDEETGVVEEQATRKEEVTNALTLSRMGSFIFLDYVDFAHLPVSHTVRSPPDMMQINLQDWVAGRFD